MPSDDTLAFNCARVGDETCEFPTEARPDPDLTEADTGRLERILLWLVILTLPDGELLPEPLALPLRPSASAIRFSARSASKSARSEN